MPTVVRKVTRRGELGGEYIVNMGFYDTTKDGWFVRLDDPEILESLYKSQLDQLRKEEIERLKNEVNTTISNEEFRRIVLQVKGEGIEEKYRRKFSDFQNFLLYFKEPFDQPYYQPRYAVHTQCLAPLLQNVDEKVKYVVEKGSERLLRARKQMSLEEFSKTFKYLSEYYNLQGSTEPVTLEFEHFSESKI